MDVAATNSVTVTGNFAWATALESFVGDISSDEKVRAAIKHKMKNLAVGRIIGAVVVDRGVSTLAYRYVNVAPFVDDGDRESNKKFVYTLRGRMLYAPHFCVNEWVNGLKSLIWFPLATLIRKIIVPLILRPFACFLPETLKERVEKDWEHYMPLKALIGLIVHPVLALLSLLSCGLASRYFNLLNGDLERWINGHTENDVMTKSRARRCHEMPYFMPCQQPETRLDEVFATIPNTIDLASAGRMGFSDNQWRNLAQQVVAQDNGSYHPFVIVEGERQNNFFPSAGVCREHGCSFT